MGVRQRLIKVVLGALLVFGGANIVHADNWDGPLFSEFKGKARRAIKVLQVNLTFNQEGSLPIIVNSVERKRGRSFQTYLHEEGQFTLKVLDVNRQYVFQTRFDAPTEIHVPPMEHDEPTEGQVIEKLKRVDFALTIPFFEDARLLQILEEDVILAEYSLSYLPEVKTKDRFKSRRGEATPKQSRLQLLDAYISDEASAATNDGTALDVAIVGDNYTQTDLALFHQNVDKVIAHMMTYEPYKTRASQILFHRVENTSVDLLCKYSTSTARLLTCNGTSVTNFVNNAGAPYDKIIVLVKSSTYGGSGGNISVSYNGTSMPYITVHEFGHSLASLLDEYNLYTTNGTINNTTYANCYAGTPPNALWSDLTGVTYAKGCKYPNWYRSSPCSIMQSLSCRYFNEVSKQAINAKLDFYAGPFETETHEPEPTSNPDPVATTNDAEGPSVVIRSPTGTVITKSWFNYLVEGKATTDNLVSVSLYINGVRKSTVNKPNVQGKWIAGSWWSTPRGTHEVKGVAVDSSGRITETTVMVTY